MWFKTLSYNYRQFACRYLSELHVFPKTLNFFNYVVLLTALLLIVASFSKKEFYFEPNPIEYLIWNKDFDDNLYNLASLYKLKKILCIFPNNEFSVEGLLRLEKIPFDSINNTPPPHLLEEILGGFFRVVWIDENGEVEVWRFDENRFNVSFNTGIKKTGCRTEKGIRWKILQSLSGTYDLKFYTQNEKM